VEGHIDASYAIHDDGKSHSGIVVLAGGTPIVTKSNRQKIVTRSSTEAELVALSDKLQDVICIREFLVGQGMKIPVPIVWQDNMSTIAIVRQDGHTLRNTHMNVRREWIKERVAAGDVLIKYKPTNDMVADFLTKPLQGNRFRTYADVLLGRQQEGGALIKQTKDDSLLYSSNKAKLQNNNGGVVSINRIRSCCNNKDFAESEFAEASGMFSHRRSRNAVPATPRVDLSQ
jgi:hypothetical protein